jgi:hypothetical protein
MNAPMMGNQNNLASKKYPDAADMPEMGAPTPGSPEAGQMDAKSNPVMQALQTIQSAVLAMAEKSPNGNEIKQKFAEFLSSLTGAAGGGGAGTPPPPGAPIPGQAPGGNKPAAMPSTGGTAGAIAPNAAGANAKPMI